MLDHCHSFLGDGVLNLKAFESLLKYKKLKSLAIGIEGSVGAVDLKRLAQVKSLKQAKITYEGVLTRNRFEELKKIAAGLPFKCDIKYHASFGIER